MLTLFRKFPIDMAGFAVNVSLLLEYPDALFGYNPHARSKAEGGWQETRFLENFAIGRNDSRVECLGSDTEVLSALRCTTVFITRVCMHSRGRVVSWFVGVCVWSFLACSGVPGLFKV